MALVRNNSVPGTSTTSYGFSSSSLTHQKQPLIPSDQREKILAMHQDGAANAGIYVAVVLFVYLVLVIMLLCRYAKRRRTSEPLAAIDSSTTEQGRFRLLDITNGKLTCARSTRQGSLTHFCFTGSNPIDSTTTTAAQDCDEDSCRDGKMAVANKSDDQTNATTRGNLQASIDTDAECQAPAGRGSGNVVGDNNKSSQADTTAEKSTRLVQELNEASSPNDDNQDESGEED